MGQQRGSPLATVFSLGAPTGALLRGVPNQPWVMCVRSPGTPRSFQFFVVPAQCVDGTRPSVGRRAGPSVGVPACRSRAPGHTAGATNIFDCCHHVDAGCCVFLVVSCRPWCWCCGGSGARVGGWYGSDRRDRLPRDWAAIRAMVRERAHNHCQARVHSALCNGMGDDCDHIVPGDDHSLANLQWLNHNCHKLKTARESAERNARRARQRRHPVEKNPGSFR